MPGFPSIERGPKLDSITWMSCEAPCDGCPLSARCRAEKLACEQFNLFFRRGGTAWRHLPRDPTARIYRTVFRSGVKAVKPRKTARRAKAKQARGPLPTVREICASHAAPVP